MHLLLNGIHVPKPWILSYLQNKKLQYTVGMTIRCRSTAFNLKCPSWSMGGRKDMFWTEIQWTHGLQTDKGDGHPRHTHSSPLPVPLRFHSQVENFADGSPVLYWNQLIWIPMMFLKSFSPLNCPLLACLPYFLNYSATEIGLLLPLRHQKLSLSGWALCYS